jgi:antitoxin PrlF
MALAKLTSKGQLTVPKQVREHLGLRVGDRVEFRIEPDGSARMLSATRKAVEVVGMLSRYRKKKPVSVLEMDEDLRKAFRKDRP